MKIAIIQDELVRRGGAEQVVLSFQVAFPEAPIYTLSYNPDHTFPEFKDSFIKTSWLGKIAKDDVSLKRYFFPLGIWAMRTMNVTGYDVVLLSTTHCAKYIKVDKNTLVLTYCHTPFRLAWQPNSYEDVSNSNFLMKALYGIVVKFLRRREKISAMRTDWFLTNSKEVVPRIEAAYKPIHPVTVINPAVKCKNFYIADKIGEYFLVVSRFESYKKVDLVIEAFNKMPDKKLLVIGKGSMEEDLRAMAGPNITISGGLDAKHLAKVFAEAKALIFPQHEDYGITPLESNASGRPVIAYGFGGIKETMIPYENDLENATALFFYEQTSEALVSAVRKFETISFDSAFIRKHAESFDEGVFIKKIRNFVAEKYALQLSGKALNVVKTENRKLVLKEELKSC
jgi:glycosyltransferase involved in cell wall biosynthesis